MHMWRKHHLEYEGVVAQTELAGIVSVGLNHVVERLQSSRIFDLFK